MISLYNSQSNGTGFIGEIEINGEDSIVLVTNYHVMIGGLHESYETATIVTPSMKKAIEKNAMNSEIQFGEGEPIRLSKGMLVEESSKVSPAKSVCLSVNILYT